MAPFQADARTAYFGKGSKASAFYFGTSVSVHTCDGSKGDPKQSVRMMTIDSEKMEERTKAGNCVDTYAPGPPYSTYGLRESGSTQEAGSRGRAACGGGRLCVLLRVPASGVPYDRVLVAPQAGKDAWEQELRFRAKTDDDRRKVRSLAP